MDKELGQIGHVPDLRQTKPIWSSSRAVLHGTVRITPRGATTNAGPSAPNKANWGSGWKPGSRLCKTNPICAGRPAMGAGQQVGPAGAIRPNVRNKANFSIADFGLWIADWGQTCGGSLPSGLPSRSCTGQLCKQTQFARGCTAGPPWRQSCETKPISRLRIADWDGPAAGRLSCDLTSRACAGQLYKQTQFARGCTAGPPWRQSCEKTQSAGGAQQWARGGKSAPPVPPSQTGETKPISRRRQCEGSGKYFGKKEL